MGYRSALYFGVGISAVALILDVLFVRLVKDDRQGWHDEDNVAVTGDAELAQQSQEVK